MEGYFHPDLSQKRSSSDASPTRKAAKAKSVDPHEAVRRGLSFGPIKQQARQHSTAGILKKSSESPQPGTQRRSLSASDETRLSQDGKGRVPKDRYPRTAAGKSLDSSEDEDAGWSSGEERNRGRSPSSRNIYPNKDGPALSDSEEQSQAGEASDSHPEGGEALKKTTSKRFVVHPNTNYDKPLPKPRTRTLSPTLSEEEELEATQRAQALPIFSSPPDNSVTHRTMQALIRGDFGQMQQEAKEGTRRLRTYLAATDLSGEAAFALEWTIGTVMRDGDTLIAVYAVDEAQGTGKIGDSLPIGEGAASMRDTASVMESMTVQTQKASLIPFPSPLTKKALRPSSRKGSAATSTDSRALSVAQQERAHALQALQETCLGLLRKTGLQCRVVIEVIHCKNPKYMITEAIDGLKPELVIIGSRGRSSLKGVLLGSFSNYVVTKSSVPVMVARKRLSGRKTKVPAPNVQLTNNLRPNERLARARID